MKRKNYKYLALGGVVGPVLFLIMVLVNGMLRPGYSHLHQFISDLGATATPNAQLMNIAGFIPTGLLVATFGLSIMLMLPKTIFSRIGSVLVIVFGLGLFIAGLYSCDVGCPTVGSMENIIHNRVSAVAFLSVILGVGMLAFVFKRLEYWRPFWKYSLITAILSLLFLIAMITSIKFYSYIGIWQRLLLFTLFLWCVKVGQRIFRSSKELGY